MSGFSNMLRRGTPSLDVERETFEKNQLISMQKAMNSVECAAKEKHIRNTLLGTHREKAAKTFWGVASKMPIDSQPIIGWKFCHVLHKIMREGHPNALRDSTKYHKNIQSLSAHWKTNSYGYGILISLYLNALSARMDFHLKYQSVPGTLTISEEDLESICGSDINLYFALCVDILECIETQLQLQSKVFGTLDMSKAISLTGLGQCRLAPLIPVILDTSQLYDCAIKVLFKLHGCLPADVLSGHRERFTKCHMGLGKFYHICSNLEYFKRLLLIPSVPDKVPDFFIQSDGSHELGPIEMVEDDEVDGGPPSPEPSVGQLVDTTTADDIFNMQLEQSPTHVEVDPRDNIIANLRAQIERLKAEIELMQSEHSEEVWKLLERIKLLEEELKNRQAMVESTSKEVEEMRKEVADAQKQTENAVKEQSLLINVEKKAAQKAAQSEIKFQKIKEKMMKLVEDHANLLRQDAERKKLNENLQQNIEGRESEKDTYQAKIDELEKQLEAKATENSTGQEQNEELKKELEAQKDEMNNAQEENENLKKELETQKTEMSTAQEQNDELKKELEAQKGEINTSLRQIDELRREIEAQKTEKTDAELQRRRKMKAIIDAAVMGSRDVIAKAVTSLDEEGSESRKCSAGTFLHILDMADTTTQMLDESLSKFQSNEEIDGLVQALSQFGHYISSSIENGAATLNMASGITSDLDEQCRNCGRESLDFLEQLRSKENVDDECCDTSQIRHKLEEMKNSAKLLLPQGSDVAGLDLRDVVDKEMSATSQAVEEAAARIEALLNEARERDSGVHLEVNERILDSCTDLMSRIRILIASAKELQREIVDTGRGASSPKDFYMKNSRWTEGLISASKAVGFAATMMTDAADDVCKGEGKFEELIVCSQEITASTAQLTAASKVKASKNSSKLHKLQVASKDVNVSAGRVVANTKEGRHQLTEEDENLNNLFNTASLTQVKREEMNSKVRVLELEKMLEDERLKMSMWKRKHYELAAEEEENNQQEEQTSRKNEPIASNEHGDIGDKPTVAQKPVLPPKPSLN